MARNPTFTAITFNMQNGEPWVPGEETPAPELEGTLQFLRSVDADIICLQEVEQGHDGGHQNEPAPNYHFLKDGLRDYHSVFAYPPKNPDELPFGLGLAILSRFPLEGFWKLALPAGDLDFEFGGRRRRPSDRLLIGAGTVVHGRSLAVMNTHLQAYFMIGSTSNEHPAQRNAVADRLESASGATLLSGDFNCTPEEKLPDQFLEKGFPTVQNNQPTWRRKPFAVDHIFYGTSLKCLSWEVLETPASDHHAVRAAFEFVS